MIRAPSPTNSPEVNDLDILPEKKLYTGLIQVSRGGSKGIVARDWTFFQR